MIFGRGGAGGVVNRVQKEAGFQPVREVSLQGGMHGNKRFTTDLAEPVSETVAFRVNGMFENSDSFRTGVDLDRYGLTPTLTIAPSARTQITLSYEYLHDTRTADRGITSFQNAPADVDPSLFYGNPNDSHVRLGVNLGMAAVEHQFGSATLRNRTVIAGYDRFYQNYVPGAANAAGTLVALDGLQQCHAADQRVQSDGCALHRIHGTRPSYLPHGRRVRPPGDRQLSEHGLLQQHHHLASGPVLESDDLDARDLPAKRHRRRQPSAREGRRDIRAGSDRTLSSGPAARRSALRPIRLAVSQQSQRRHAHSSRQPAVTAGGDRGEASSRPCRSTAATAFRTCRAPAISLRR